VWTGDKYIYESLPRLLTLWFNYGLQVTAASGLASPSASAMKSVFVVGESVLFLFVHFVFPGKMEALKR
jgi:hypothetical protein